MAARPTPFIDINNNQEATYHSFDAIDQGTYDALNFRYERNAFLQVVRQWLNAVAEGFDARPMSGQGITDRWNNRRNYWISRMQKRKTPRPTHPPASQAVAPVAIIPVLPPVNVHGGAPSATSAVEAQSPPGSPLAELSPRFACQGDESEGRLLSPTRGQADLVANDLKKPWKFADVVHQIEPRQRTNRIPLAPTTSVHLFVRPNNRGYIEEQLAVKCLEVHEMADGEPGATLDDINAAVHREIEINRLIRSTRCSHISKFRGHGERKPTSHVIRPHKDFVQSFKQRAVHLYHDFAGCGDLKTLIGRHREEQRPINEHFIWYTLRELTEALIALKDGHCSKPHKLTADVPASDESLAPLVIPWVPILHLDIKTQNVLLEAENPEYSAYPKPVLADFGISCQATAEVIDLNHAGSEPAHCPRFAGTSGWHPPERHEACYIPHAPGNDPTFDPEYEPFKWILSEKSDVWALGLIAHKMMYAHRVDTVVQPDGNSRISIPVQDATLSVEGAWRHSLRGRKIGPYESHFTLSAADIAHLPDVYSVRLCAMVAACMRHDLESRPSLTDLLDRCQQELARLETLHGPVAGKRKRDEGTKDDFTILASDEERNKKFGKFENGRFYEPKHSHRKMDLADVYRDKYIKHIHEWDAMPRPKPTAQDNLINTTLAFLLDEDKVNDSMLVDDEETLKPQYEWAVKYLVSCLRKRTNPKSGAYILTTDYIEGNNGLDWIEEIFEPETKIQILEHLRDTDELWTTNPDEEVQEALAVFRNAIVWGLMLLQDTEDGIPAVPRTPKLDEPSGLHMGVYDWIFVRPSGAFFKG